jgi:hypothetical protein
LGKDEQSGKQTDAISLRISVSEVQENGDVHQLRSNVVRRLFHMHNDERSRPILVLFSSEIEPLLTDVHRRKRRYRRTSNGLDSNHNGDSLFSPVASTGVNCDLHQWQVNLSSLLGKRIIVPQSPLVNFCSGSCPFPAFDSHWNATSNAVIRNAFVATGRINVIADFPNDLVPDATCVPHSLRPLTILYFEDGKHIIKMLDHVVATSCMCA